jgi:hypothetical protein
MTQLLKSLLMACVIGLGASGVGATDEDEREGGIIGTGILGTITALGSIYVNGQHIEFAPDQTVEDGLNITLARDLRPGHTVAVVASPDGEDWQAHHVRMVYPLVGPAQIAQDGTLWVMGSQVVTDQTVAEGAWIAVSGLWQGDRVLASQITTLPKNHQSARITGTYLARDAQGDILIGGSRLQSLDLQHAQPGMALRVFGDPTPQGIQAYQVEASLFDGQVGVMQVQGYYSPPQPDGLYTVLGSGLLAYTDQPSMISETFSVIRCGAQGKLSGSVEGLC